MLIKYLDQLIYYKFTELVIFYGSIFMDFVSIPYLPINIPINFEMSSSIGRKGGMNKI